MVSHLFSEGNILFPTNLTEVCVFSQSVQTDVETYGYEII